MTDHIKEYAQYIADRIDASIFLKYTVDGITEDEAFERAAVYLRDEGWQGRKYPTDFFRMASVAERAGREIMDGLRKGGAFDVRGPKPERSP